VLVVCALALVVAAAVFLVIGLAGGDVGDLYLSMALCLASLVVVAVSARLSRVKAAPAASEPPAPVSPEGAEEAEAETSPVAVEAAVAAPEPVAAPAPAPVADPTAGLGARLVKADRPEPTPTPVDDGSIWAAAPPPSEAEADEEGSPPRVDPEPEPEPEPAPRAGADAAPPTADDDAVAGAFPIADYDDLAVEQILPLVPQLWPEEVPVVAARERATKARPAVLDALAEAAGDPALGFPIPEYERLDTEQITRLLDRLDAAELATVQAAERSGPARVGVLVAVANQLAARR